jgi:hypothetical protein
MQMRDEVEKLLLDCNAHDGIDILDAFLSLSGRPIGPGVIFEWLCCRAKFLLEVFEFLPINLDFLIYFHLWNKFKLFFFFAFSREIGKMMLIWQ